MTNDEREIQRKLRVLQFSENVGDARKACAYYQEMMKAVIIVGAVVLDQWRQQGILMHVHSVLPDELLFVQTSASQTWIE